MNQRNPSDDLREAIAAQRDRIGQLRTWERELDALQDVEADLEVQKISAEVALQSATAKKDFGIDPKDAAAIGEALARKRELERAMLPPADGNTGGQSEADQLRAGIEALNGWLRAAGTAAGWRRPKVAYASIGIACLLTIGAALAVHVMLLVLLVPLLMAIGYLAFTDRDADWVRLGATRRFGQTMLPPPAVWETSAVKSRLSDLESELASAEARLAESGPADDAPAGDSETEDLSEVALAMELVETNDQLDAALQNAGIVAASVDDELAKWLLQVYEVHRTGNDLGEVRAKRKSMSRLAEESRDAIFRFLALNDAAPPGGRADTGSLDASLQRLAARAKEM